MSNKPTPQQPAATKKKSAPADPAKRLSLISELLDNLRESFSVLGERLGEEMPGVPDLPEVEDFIGGETDLVIRWNIVAETAQGEVLVRRKGMQCVPDLLDPDNLAQAGRTLGTVLNLQLSSPLLRSIEAEVRRRIQQTIETPVPLPKTRQIATLDTELLAPDVSSEDTQGTAHPEDV